MLAQIVDNYWLYLPREAGVDAPDGAGRHGEQQAAFRSEALDEGGGGEAGFARHFRQRQPHGAEAGHGALGGEEDRVVGNRTGAGAHLTG